MKYRLYKFHVFSLGIIEEIVDDTLKIKLFTDVMKMILHHT